MHNSFNKPKVSIIIPVYNGSNFLARAIDSALEQSYANIEILVINDGSCDGGETERIALSYGDKIRYFKKENGGVASALNLGIKQMQGEYFAWLSHDDEYHPDYLRHSVNLLNTLPPNTIVGCGFAIIDENNKEINRVLAKGKVEEALLKQGVPLLLKGFIHGCGLLIPKKCFFEISFFDENLPTTQDYELFFKLFKKVPFTYLPFCGVLSRCHNQQGSKLYIKEHVEECEKLWIQMVNGIPSDLQKQWGTVCSYSDFIKEVYEGLEKRTSYKSCVLFAKAKYLKFLLEKKEFSLFAKETHRLFNWNQNDVISLIKKFSKKKNNKRVFLYLEQDAPTSGLNKMVLKLADLLAEDYSIIVSFNENVEFEKSKFTTIKLPWGSNFPSGENGGLASEVALLAYLLDVDVLVNPFNCLKSKLEFFSKAKIFSIKTIAWNHEHYFGAYYLDFLLPEIIDRVCYLKDATKVIWINKKSTYLYDLLAENGTYLPNCFSKPKEIKKSEPRLNSRRIKLLAVGRFDDVRKRLDLVLEVFKKVFRVNQCVELILVGPYNLEGEVPSSSEVKYKDFIKNLGIPAKSITFIGEVQDPSRFYQEADLLVNCSENEGFGLIIGEAASFGLPAVIFGGSGSEDLIEDNVNGFVVPFGETKEMARRILQIISDEDYYKQIQRNLGSILEKFSEEKFKLRWISLIELITGEGTPVTNNLDVVDRRMVTEILCDYEKFLNHYIDKEEKFRKTHCERYNELYKQYLGLANSRSWRITKPLRTAKYGLKKIKKILTNRFSWS